MSSHGRRRGRGWWKLAGRTLAYLLILAGLGALGGAAYLLYGTGIQVGPKQTAAEDALERHWREGAGERPDPAAGEPFARIGIPRFGTARFPVSEGVAEHTLGIGPGHYPESGLPGEPGNFALAGYRTGYGAPFEHVDQLKACDAIVVETARDFFIYRVMPMEDQIADWESARPADPRCARVPSLRTGEPDGGPYGEVAGRKVIPADRAEAVATVPYRAQSDLATTDQVSLLTLTTPHVQHAFDYASDEQIAVHAVLTDQIGKGNAGAEAYDRLLEHLHER